jgi:hypothetical protein
MSCHCEHGEEPIQIKSHSQWMKQVNSLMRQTAAAASKLLGCRRMRTLAAEAAANVPAPPLATAPIYGSVLKASAATRRQGHKNLQRTSDIRGFENLANRE